MIHSELFGSDCTKTWSFALADVSASFAGELIPAYSKRERTDKQDFDISYPAIGLHPGTSVRLTASYSGDTIPTFHIEPFGEGARLLAKGSLTWIIRNEVEVLFGFLVAWVVTVIFALGKITGGGGNGD